MRALPLAVLLVAAGLAAGAPAAGADRFRAPATATGGNPAWVRTRVGAGAARAAEMDEVTFRYDLRTAPAWQGVEHVERTARLHEVDGWLRTLLATMAVGERRRAWVREVDPDSCDHVDCSAILREVVDLELVALRAFHDPLPGGQVIASDGGRRVAIRRGATVAWVPVPFAIEALDEVRSSPGGVEVTVAPACGTGDVRLTFTLAQLDARLEVAAARRLERRRPAAAIAGYRRAIVFDASLDEAHLGLARALLRLGRSRDAVAAVAPVLARNPVWLDWRTLVEPGLAALRREPELQALRAVAPGSFDVAGFRVGYGDGGVTYGVEPRGRYLAAHTVYDWRAERFAQDAVSIIDRRSGAVAAVLPLRLVGGTRDQVASVQRALRELGFSPAAGEVATITSLDPGRVWPIDNRLTFARAGVEAIQSRRGVAIAGAAIVDATAPPVAGPITDARLLPDALVFHVEDRLACWADPHATAVVVPLTARPPLPASPPTAPPPAAPPPDVRGPPSGSTAGCAAGGPGAALILGLIGVGAAHRRRKTT
ncbi:MAG: hypothetical protein JNK64_39375 [Myxococcales bacterium]|nr:hypothetical protein [Myxococcales bacterium]